MREFLKKLDSRDELIKVKKSVDPKLELARVQNRLDGNTVLYEKIKGSKMRVVSGVCSSRKNFALDLGVKKEQLLQTLAKAVKKPEKPRVASRGACQEVVEKKVDLGELPILTHLPGDGGPYITSAIAVIKDPDYGRNVSFHRLMKTGRNTFTARVIEGRGTDSALKKALARGDGLEVAFCVGNSLPVMLAAATSPPSGVDELGIANALRATPLVKCVTKDLEVPTSSEIVLEGRITGRLGKEGPFYDLTNTFDVVRQQPVIEVDCITHKRNPIYHALLPGSSEHKLLMGMPREPTIYNEVARVCDCRNVLVTPGGCSWLHAVVQIKKKKPDDGRKALKAAFRGHSSLKHCVVVDEDIEISNPLDVEWAVATRVQADTDVIVMKNQPSSSLDPSAKKPAGKKARGTKAGIDATIPWKKGKTRKGFEKVSYGKVRLGEYL